MTGRVRAERRCPCPWVLALALAAAVPGQRAGAQQSAALRRWARDLERAGVDELGCAVIDLESGATIFSHNATRALIPASNMKLVTTAAALDLLGPKAVLDTEIFAAGKLENGRLEGDLWFVGYGDPGLQEPFLKGDPGAPLRRVGERLKELGIGAVTGRLILDGRAFDGQLRHPSWPANQLHKAYAAPITALAIGGGCLEIGFARAARNGRRSALLLPAGHGLDVRNRTRCSSTCSWNALLRGDTCVLTGSLPARGSIAPQRFAQQNPETIYARVLLQRLREAGIALRNGWARADSRPPGGKPLLSFGSDVGAIVTQVNKHSLNHAAGCLWKHLGYRLEKLGSFESGARAARLALHRLGLEDADIQACTLAEGSGLARANRLSAKLLTRLLRACVQRPWAETFISSLPVAGRDGTLSKRMRAAPLAGKVRAKTGWIAGAGSLAGYLQCVSGRRLAFAIVANYPKNIQGLNRRCIKPAQERLLRLLALEQ